MLKNNILFDIIYKTLLLNVKLMLNYKSMLYIFNIAYCVKYHREKLEIEFNLHILEIKK